MNTMEERLSALENELALLRAEKEIAQLMSRYQRMLSCGEIAKIPEMLFASGSDGAFIEYGASGPYTGFKKLSTFYEKDVFPGQFTILALTTPDIRVNEDLGNAKGTWTVIGTELDAGELGPAPERSPEEKMLMSLRSHDGKAYKADWVWQRYEVSFISEKGCWKIHQLRIWDLLRCPFDTDFVKASIDRWKTDGIRLDLAFTSNIPFAEGELPENLPGGPTLKHWQYSPDSLPPLFE
ncbi:MAG: nuclear transport factor 2 family protein [Lachnospiraceae bacterium]|nr:nuclear transport factor 2 family protein [Lachnospiraceae bacterium]